MTRGIAQAEVGARASPFNHFPQHLPPPSIDIGTGALRFIDCGLILHLGRSIVVAQRVVREEDGAFLTAAELQ